MTVTLDFDSIVLWIVVGLVAGFFASHVTLGRGLGAVGDVIAGMVGASIGGFIFSFFHWNFTVVGHPVISEMVIAFLGAVVLLLVMRLFSAGRGSRKRIYG